MKQLGRYEILEKIGEGGMGTVYRAKQPTLNKIVALKVLADFCAKDEELVERFMREARIMASLPDYRHVVQVFDLDEIDGKYFYTMEYMPRSLSEHIGDSEITQDRTRKVNRKSKMMPVVESIQFTLHILEGLKVIHKAGVTHRDISPQNIMLVKHGDDLTAKITDFGIAGLEGSHLTKSATGIGKEVYASPEQLESLSDADARSDIYSLGILMYRMTTGRLPIGRFKEPAEINADIDTKFNKIILKCMEYEPDDRYQSTGEMLEELTDTEERDHRTVVQNETTEETPSLAEDSVKGSGDCEILCADDFHALPQKYQWDKKKTLDTINRWSNEYLGVLSNIADCCEVLDVQSHGYFVWRCKAVIEKREWTEYRKGINVPDPSGPFEFLKHKPPRIPGLSPEMTERLGEICPDCKGTGDFVCDTCYGNGDIQCPKCKGTGAYIDPISGNYKYGNKCLLCNGSKKIPCTACEGVSQRLCVSCNGKGINLSSRIVPQELPKTRNTATLWSVKTSMSTDPWAEVTDHVVATEPSALEVCTNCKGTGDFVCDTCYGNGDIQCPKCKGTGAYIDPISGNYKYDNKCLLCNGSKNIPCTACKGVPKRDCEVCRGSGIVAVYPAAIISRTVSKTEETSIPTVSSIKDRYIAPLAVLEGISRDLPEVAATLVDHFEGAGVLRTELGYLPTDNTAQLTRFKVDLYWYPYMLCRMKNPKNSRDFVIGVNCTNGTVFLVNGKCPKGGGFGSVLLGWASEPFDIIMYAEVKFMLKQLSQGEHAGNQGNGTVDG